MIGQSTFYALMNQFMSRSISLQFLSPHYQDRKFMAINNLISQRRFRATVITSVYETKKALSKVFCSIICSVQGSGLKKRTVPLFRFDFQLFDNISVPDFFYSLLEIFVIFFS